MDDKEAEKNDQLFSFFAELEAFAELSDRAFEKIRFLPEKDEKQPDLRAEYNRLHSFFEVKRIRSPRDEKETLRKTGWDFGDINDAFRNGLVKKISDFMQDALLKFDAVGIKDRSSRFLIIDYQPGIDSIVESEERRNLEGILGEQYFNELERTHQITIWPRKYFET